MTIARHTVAPLLLALACTACGLGEDPLAAPNVGSPSSPPALSQTPSSNPDSQCQTCSQAQHHSEVSSDIAAGWA